MLLGCVASGLLASSGGGGQLFSTDAPGEMSVLLLPLPAVLLLWALKLVDGHDASPERMARRFGLGLETAAFQSLMEEAAAGGGGAAASGGGAEGRGDHDHEHAALRGAAAAMIAAIPEARAVVLSTVPTLNGDEVTQHALAEDPALQEKLLQVAQWTAVNTEPGNGTSVAFAIASGGLCVVDSRDFRLGLEQFTDWSAAAGGSPLLSGGCFAVTCLINVRLCCCVCVCVFCAVVVFCFVGIPLPFFFPGSDAAVTDNDARQPPRTKRTPTHGQSGGSPLGFVTAFVGRAKSASLQHSVTLEKIEREATSLAFALANSRAERAKAAQARLRTGSGVPRLAFSPSPLFFLRALSLLQAVSKPPALTAGPPVCSCVVFLCLLVPFRLVSQREANEQLRISKEAAEATVALQRRACMRRSAWAAAATLVVSLPSALLLTTDLPLSCFFHAVPLQGFYLPHDARAAHAPERAFPLSSQSEKAAPSPGPDRRSQNSHPPPLLSSPGACEKRPSERRRPAHPMRRRPPSRPRLCRVGRCSLRHTQSPVPRQQQLSPATAPPQAVIAFNTLVLEGGALNSTDAEMISSSLTSASALLGACAQSQHRRRRRQ